MSAATASIRIRDSVGNSAAALCETFNALDALVLATGMLPVSETEVSGQAGTFVTGTPKTGETQIMLTTDTAGDALCGNKVYQHPSLGFYLQVGFYDSGYRGDYRFAKIGYAVGIEAADGALVPSQCSPLIWPFDTLTAGYGSYFALVSLPANYTPAKASCGVDHFWIGNVGIGVPQAYNPAFSWRPFSASDFGFGVFASLLDPTKLLVTASSEVEVYQGIYGANLVAQGVPAQRYWAYDGAWAARARGAASFLIDPEAPALNQGIRVAPAQLVLGGEVHPFNFGFVPASAVADLQELSVALIGAERTYVAQRSMGPSNPNVRGTPTAAMCCPIFPWAG